MKSYDLMVIGTGPAGQRAAIQAAKLGKRVAIVEKKDVVGGTCINTATVPSKTLREAVLDLSGFRQRNLYGASYTVKKDITIEDLMFRCDRVIKNEIDVVHAQLTRNHVDLLTGEASFVDPHHLRVHTGKTTEEYETDFVIIATGSIPAHSDKVQMNGRTIIDSDMIFRLPSIPKTMTIVGAGVVGTEYACMFATLGVKVVLIDLRPRLLEFVDAEIIEALCYHMRNTGVTLRLGEEVDSVEHAGEHQVVAHLKSRKLINSEVLLYSVGRLGNTGGLNLEAAGLTADARGRIKVDSNFRTAVPNIYAVGDVIGFPNLASVAQEQGRLAACHAFGHQAISMPELFPYGIYTIPELSFVGQTEQQLTTAGVPYETGVARYREIARGQIIGDQAGMLKLLFHRVTKKLLGVHIIGEGATELVHIGQTVLAFEGTIDYFVNNVFNYPTLAECYKVAALAGINKL